MALPHCTADPGAGGTGPGARSQWNALYRVPPPGHSGGLVLWAVSSSLGKKVPDGEDLLPYVSCGPEPWCCVPGEHRGRRCLPGRGGQLRRPRGRGDCPGGRGQRGNPLGGAVVPHPGGGGVSGNPSGHSGGPLRGTGGRGGHLRGGGHAPGPVDGGRGGKRSPASGGAVHQYGGKLPLFQGAAGGAGPGAFRRGEAASELCQDYPEESFCDYPG